MLMKVQKRVLFSKLKKYIDIRVNKANMKIKAEYDEAKLSSKVSSIADSINVKMKMLLLVLEVVD